MTLHLGTPINEKKVNAKFIENRIYIRRINEKSLLLMQFHREIRIKLNNIVYFSFFQKKKDVLFIKSGYFLIYGNNSDE